MNLALARVDDLFAPFGIALGELRAVRDDGLHLQELIVDEGTLSSRLTRSVGPHADAAALLATYRRLSNCLAEGRMFHAGG